MFDLDRLRLGRRQHDLARILHDPVGQLAVDRSQHPARRSYYGGDVLQAVAVEIAGDETWTAVPVQDHGTLVDARDRFSDLGGPWSRKVGGFPRRGGCLLGPRGGGLSYRRPPGGATRPDGGERGGE